MKPEQLAIDPAQPALVGVSGGRDSVVLLHALLARGCQGLVVCHLDHGLRPESGADAGWVRALAAECGLPFEMERVDVTPAGAGIEAAARAARYAFFARAAQARGCARVYLGHHADDQVETFLLNLCRGSGTAGLAAMSAASERLEGPVTLELLRPLLGIWGEEIEAYASLHGLTWRVDPSNATPAHARNRLRLQGIPGLSAALGRDVRGALWRAAEILRGEEEWMQGQISVLGGTLGVEEVRAMPLAMQRRTIRVWLRNERVQEVTFEDVERVRGLVEEEQPAKVNLPGGVHARRRAGEIWVER